MKQRVNYDALMAKYAKDLDMNLDEIKVDEQSDDVFEDDPELKALQKKLNLNNGSQQYNSIAQQMKLQPLDEADMALNAYERPQQQKPQQKQQQQSSAQNQQSDKIIQLEQQITIPSQMKSLTLLQQEIKFINENILPKVKKVQQMNNFYQALISNLQAQQNGIINMIKDEQLTAGQYQQQVLKNYENEQIRFKNDNSSFRSRIGDRCKCLYEELELLKRNKFEKIAQQFGCGEDPALKLLYEEFNSKPYKQKATELLQRHKQYLNFTQYLSINLKQERKNDIDNLINKLEKSKQFQEEFKKGNDPNIAQFIFKEFQELTEDFILGMNKLDYQAGLQALNDQISQAYKEEQLYYKIASTAKPILQQLPGQKQIVKINPGDISKQYFARYDQMKKYLDELKNNSDLIPLPIIKIENETRQISTDNRDVPQNILRVQFKNLIQGSKLYLTYQVNLGGQYFQQKTPQADNDGKLNYSQDINLKEYKNSLKDIHNQKIEIKAMKKGVFSDDVKGQGSITLGELLEMSTHEGDVLLGNKGLVLQYCIQLRESINKKKSVTIVTIVKTFPPIKINEGIEAYLAQKLQEIPNQPNKSQIQNNEKSESQIIKKTKIEQSEQTTTQIQQQTQQVKQQEQQIEEQQQVQEQEQEQGPKLSPEKLIILIHQDEDEEYQRVKEFAEKNQQLKEDFLYPENPVSAGVYYFLEQYVPFIQKKSPEYRSEPSMKVQFKFTQKLFEDCFRQQFKIKKQLEDDLEGYSTNLDKIIKKDQLLVKLYTQIKATTWAKFVEARLEIALQEQQGLSQM